MLHLLSLPALVGRLTEGPVIPALLHYHRLFSIPPHCVVFDPIRSTVTQCAPYAFG
jgi:hypothetical protein